MDEVVKAFMDNSVVFKADTKRALALAKAIDGIKINEASDWAVRIFTRLCAACNSIISLLDEINIPDRAGSLDHGSILSICRIVIESHIMLEYATDRDMNYGQFLLKRMIFDIHDCSTRVRFFKGLGDSEEAKQQQANLEKLQEKIKEHLWFGELSKEKQADILAGRIIYLDGFRKAAEGAGWESAKFDAVYAYLSAQIHSAPMSFYRTDKRGINYQRVSEYQFGVVGYALELTGWSLSHATKRLSELFPAKALLAYTEEPTRGAWWHGLLVCLGICRRH